MNANYSFVSYSHFLCQKDAPISKLINCLSQLLFRIVCFTSCLAGKAGVQLLQALFCPSVNKLSFIQIFVANRGKGI